jgi:hypothetical protein
MVEYPAGCGLDSPFIVEVALAFAAFSRLGTWDVQNFVAAVPRPTRSRAYASPAAFTTTVARLATGSGGSPIGRAGVAPAGRRTEFREIIASSLLSDQHCLVATERPWRRWVYEIAVSEGRVTWIDDFFERPRADRI